MFLEIKSQNHLFIAAFSTFDEKAGDLAGSNPVPGTTIFNQMVTARYIDARENYSFLVTSLYISHTPVEEFPPFRLGTGSRKLYTMPISMSIAYPILVIRYVWIQIGSKRDAAALDSVNAFKGSEEWRRDHGRDREV